MKNLLITLVREDDGQDVIEYALLAAAISVIAIPIIPGIGTMVLNAWTAISGQVSDIPGAGGAA